MLTDFMAENILYSAFAGNLLRRKFFPFGLMPGKIKGHLQKHQQRQAAGEWNNIIRMPPIKIVPCISKTRP